MVLFLIGISIMTIISNTQVKNNTEKSIITSSAALINEMGFAIENFLGQYEKGLAQFSTHTVTVLDLPKQVKLRRQLAPSTSIRHLKISLVSMKIHQLFIFHFLLNKQSLCRMQILGLISILQHANGTH